MKEQYLSPPQSRHYIYSRDTKYINMTHIVSSEKVFMVVVVQCESECRILARVVVYQAQQHCGICFVHSLTFRPRCACTVQCNSLHDQCLELDISDQLDISIQQWQHLCNVHLYRWFAWGKSLHRQEGMSKNQNLTLFLLQTGAVQFMDKPSWIEACACRILWFCLAKCQAP